MHTSYCFKQLDFKDEKESFSWFLIFWTPFYFVFRSFCFFVISITDNNSFESYSFRCISLFSFTTWFCSDCEVGIYWSSWFLEMGKLCFFLLSVVFLVSLLNGETVTAASRKKVATGARTRDASEEWGYVEVRPSKQTVSVFILYIYVCMLLVIENVPILVCVKQEHTCFGGFIGVLTELKIHPNHGQSFFGCRVDLWVPNC